MWRKTEKFKPDFREVSQNEQRSHRETQNLSVFSVRPLFSL
jgi:hypothetical protein